ncbi:28S ribosomal protein S29 [Sarcoptes scabiei]|uniref:Small ribosomal subunit protein mS29 n=1 Tax=Sarcoptes scabiei TaxID=52283 RepID=A0A834RC12_SARSC|nr:28S ribosomal protein S29 [Sarcoptes scabiei]
MNQLNRFKLITSIRWLLMNDFKEKSSQLLSISSSFFSSASKALSSSYFRTKECDPSKHQEIHNGLFYQIPKEASNRLFLFGGFDKDIQSTLNVFQEMCIMVRKPAIDVINLLNRTDFNQPPNFYVLYGPIGSGKTFTLNHILHYGFHKQFILIYCPRPTDWIRFPQEQTMSTSNPKRIDTPLDAAIWLQYFKAQNFSLLEKLNLKSLNKYTWSLREHTNVGDSLMSIVEHGINRIKHACDCMAVLLKELKLNSELGHCRLLVCSEKANAFYEPSRLLLPDRSIATVDDITIARAFKKFFKKDWKNGACVVTVCKKLVVPYRILAISGIPKKERIRDRTLKLWGPFNVNHLSDYPKALLTDEGFQDFDPFVPIEEKNWLQRPVSKTKEAHEEIKFLSGMNPGQVYNICSEL